MGRERILPYPRVHDSQIQTVLGANVVFKYLSGNESLDVEVFKEGHCRLMSPSWRPRLDPLTVCADVVIEHPSALFIDDSSHPSCVVAGENATIGVAMKWMLPETKIRGVVVGESVLSVKSRSPFLISLNKTFSAEMVRNRVDVSVELFLLKRGGVTEDVFARVVGSELASIGGNILHTGGAGGMFPTSSRASGSRAPLWELEIHIDDEFDLQRDFSGDVCMLYLNSDHKLYAEVVRTDMSGAVSPLLFEIFSECCVILLLRVLDVLEGDGRVDELDKAPNPDDESMSTIDAVRSMKRMLFPDHLAGQLREEELENLSKIVRAYLGRRLKQIEPAEIEEEQ